jgi:hypothetical protein
MKGEPHSSRCASALSILQLIKAGRGGVTTEVSVSRPLAGFRRSKQRAGVGLMFDRLRLARRLRACRKAVFDQAGLVTTMVIESSAHSQSLLAAIDFRAPGASVKDH